LSFIEEQLHHYNQFVLMEGRFKIRPMLSFSPARPKEGLFRLRARLATKAGNSPIL